MPSTPTIFATALTLGSGRALEWALVLAPETALTSVVPASPLRETILDYATRDAELAYRDVLVARHLAKLRLKAGDVFNAPLPALVQTHTIEGTLAYAAADLPLTRDLKVAYADNSEPPNAALRADQGLYYRDDQLLHSLSDAARNFYTQQVRRVQLTNRGRGYSNFVGVLFDNTYGSGALATVKASNGGVDSVSITYGGVYTQAPSLSFFDLSGTQPLEDAAGDAILYPSTNRPVTYTSGTLLPAYQSWPKEYGTLSPFTVGYSTELNEAAFRTPDLNLAARDNVLAQSTAELIRDLLSPFETAGRISVAFSGVDQREEEVFALYSETARYRIWKAEPYLSGRCQLRYDRILKTLRWFPEDNDTSHVQQAVSFGLFAAGSLDEYRVNGILNGQNIQVVPALPQVPDSEWFRQKAQRINFDPRVETLVGLYPLSTTLTSVSPILSFNASLPFAAEYAAYVDITPGGNPVPGYTQFQLGAVPGTITYRGTQTGYVAHAQCAVIPGRRDTVPFPLIVEHIQGTSVPMTFQASNLPAGSSVLVNAVQIRHRRDKALTPGADGWRAWKMELLTRAGSTIAASYQEALSAPVAQYVHETIVANAGYSITPFAIVANNPHASSFTAPEGGAAAAVTPVSTGSFSVGDTVVLFSPDAFPTTRVIVDLSPMDGGQLAILFDAPLGLINGRVVREDQSATFSISSTEDLGLVIGTRTGVVEAKVPTLAGLSGLHTASAMVLVSVPEGESTRVPLRIEVHPQSAPIAEQFLWDGTATESWMDAIVAYSEPRLRVSFRPGRPADIGRPALVPEGLGLGDGQLFSTFRSNRSVPLIRAFEAWMLDAGIYVVADDYFVPNYRRFSTIVFDDSSGGGGGGGDGSCEVTLNVGVACYAAFTPPDQCQITVQALSNVTGSTWSDGNMHITVTVSNDGGENVYVADLSGLGGIHVFDNCVMPSINGSTGQQADILVTASWQATGTDHPNIGCANSYTVQSFGPCVD